MIPFFTWSVSILLYLNTRIDLEKEREGRMEERKERGKRRKGRGGTKEGIDFRSILFSRVFISHWSLLVTGKTNLYALLFVVNPLWKHPL